MTDKTEHAFLLHKQWAGDTSARVSLFTQNSGLLHVYYKGGRSPKKQALLQVFTPLWLHVKKRHDMYFVHSLEHTAAVPEFPGNALFSALYLNELILFSIKSEAAEPVLFQAYQTTLAGLAMSHEQWAIESLLRRFEWSLLKVCGYSFSLTHEADTHELIRAHAMYRFIPEQGFVACSQGIPGAHILAIASDKFHEAPYLQSAKIIMRQAIDHLLEGRTLKTRLFMKNCREFKS